jgi:hypothetical protein
MSLCNSEEPKDWLVESNSVVMEVPPRDPNDDDGDDEDEEDEEDPAVVREPDEDE